MQESDYNKITETTTSTQTPKPVPVSESTTIAGVEELFQKYYHEQDKQLLKQYKAGQMLANSSGDDIKSVMSAIITMMLYHMSTNTNELKQKQAITCMLNCMDELMKTIDFDQYGIVETKQTVVKLLVYITKLHKKVDTYKI